MFAKATPCPIYGIYKDLEPCFDLYACEEGSWALERCIVRPLADMPRESCQSMVYAVTNTSSQRPQELLTNTDWDEQVLSSRRVEHLSRSAACEDGSIAMDETRIPKADRSSVGVARQHSSTLGKAGNCQVVVSPQYADAWGAWPVNARLCLPGEWADDPERCRTADVPDNLALKSKRTTLLNCLTKPMPFAFHT